MSTQAPKDTPFGLEPNIAAGLAYLLSWIGGIIMLAGGGTNKAVRWAAAQSIVLGVTYIIIFIVLSFLSVPLYMASWGLYLLIHYIVWLTWVAAWLWTTIAGFMGKEVRVPVIAGLTESIFKSVLAG